MVLAGLALWLPPLGTSWVDPHEARLACSPRGGRALLYLALDRKPRLADPAGGRLLPLLGAPDVLILQQFPPARRVRGLTMTASDAGVRQLHRLLNRGPTTSHRCAAYQAGRRHPRLHDFSPRVHRSQLRPVARRTVALLAFGRPLLSPCLLVRASVRPHLCSISCSRARRTRRDRPMERFLNMLGQQHAPAHWFYASAFVAIHVALCLLLIPYCGAMGSAVALATQKTAADLSKQSCLRWLPGTSSAFNVFIGQRNSTFCSISVRENRFSLFGSSVGAIVAGKPSSPR